MQIFSNTNYDFIRWRWHALALSLVVILAGVGLMVARGGIPLGIDFSGGTIVVLKFQQPTSEDIVRERGRVAAGREGRPDATARPAPTKCWCACRRPARKRASRSKRAPGASSTPSAAANIGGFEVISTEVVGPVIGKDLQSKGLYATLASIIGITLYIALRFRPSFAVGAIAATFHDILVTVAFLSFFGYELSLNVVAALLTITGYSVNDTIVIFDRVRENTHGPGAARSSRW